MRAGEIEQDWRGDLSRHARMVVLALGGWLSVAMMTALLWYPTPPAPWSERLLIALGATSLLLAGVFRLLAWLRLDQGQSPHRAQVVTLLVLASSMTALVAGGGAAYMALRPVLTPAALVLLASIGLALAAMLLTTAPRDLARMLALEPAPVPQVPEVSVAAARASDAVASPPAVVDRERVTDATARMEPVSLWAWLTAHVSERLALGIVLGVALLLRLVALGSLPATMTADEADNLQVIYRILAQREPGLFGLDWTQAPAFSLYLMTPAVWLDNLGLAGLRLTSALLSTLSLAPLYLVARRAMSSPAALAAVALLSGTLWYLHFSRSGWYNIHVALYLIALLWLVQRAVAEGRWRWYAAAGGMLALALYGYFAGRALPFALLVSMPVALALHRAAWRRVLAGYGVMFAVAAALFLPQIIVSGSALMSERIATVAITNAPRPYLGETEMGMILLRQVERTARAFLLMDPSYSTMGLNQRYIAPGWPFLDPVTALLYVIGLIVAVARWRSTWLWWPLLLAPLFMTQVFSMGTPDGARAIMLAPLMLLFTGLGLDWLIGEQRWRRPAWMTGVALGVAAVMVFNTVSYVRWQTSPAAAASRQPAVEGDEFDQWRARQWSALQDGQPGFTVSAWHEMRPPRFTQPVAPPTETVGLSGTPVSAREVIVLIGPDTPTGLSLNDPRDVAIHADGVIAVAEAGRKQVSRFAPDGRLLGRWGEAGDGAGQFDEPVALAVDHTGALHVLDAIQARVQVFGPDGHVLAVYGDDLGLYRPRGLALGDDGLLYMADTGRNRLLRFESDGTPRDTIPAQSGGSAPHLDQPTAAVVVAGTLYVVEPTRKWVQVIGASARAGASAWTLTETNTLRSARLTRGPRNEVVLTDVGARTVSLICPDDGRVLSWELPDEDNSRPLAAALGADRRLYVVAGTDATARLLLVHLEAGC